MTPCGTISRMPWAHLDEKKPVTISAERDRRAMLPAISAGPRVGSIVPKRYRSLAEPALARRQASAAGFGTWASRPAGPAIPNCRNEGRRLDAAASGRPGALRNQPQRRPLRPARHVGIGKNHCDPTQPWGSGLHGPKLNTK